ncbi:MAG: MFS transporter [Betaproteobacteria bacterium]|nr:MFS transporter [Betaproteobacteria bacterium]
MSTPPPSAAPPPDRNPWAWIPTLYFAQGMPYVMVMSVSVIMYKNLGVSNADIALYTSWLYLPWVIKPLWSPLIDLFKTKRLWVVATQFVVGVTLALVAFTLPTEFFFQMTLAMLWLMAFASATHDIAADGFYMLALPTHLQAAFVGVRSTFYRIANIAGQGALVYFAGQLMESNMDAKAAWQIVLIALAVLFAVLFAYHAWVLPRPASDAPTLKGESVSEGFVETLTSFFQRKDIVVILSFLLLYRLGEAQALKLVAPFLLDATAKGGLGLTTKDVGIAYGTIGVAALTVGGILGGVAISMGGLKRWIWPMLIACHVPNFAFVFLAYVQPSSLAVISTAIAIEQFGYGFGFAAFLMVMIMVADGPHKTAHYALCTGFMALGMMLPGMISGKVQEFLGYQHFFIWVLVCCLPSVVATWFVKIDPGFGKKAQS